MEKPFILQNIRLHGFGDIVDSQWIKVGNTITFFELPGDFNSQGVLHTLESINPACSLADGGIFQNYPKIIRQGKYQKRVRPEKRTVAFAIFIAQPVLVRELAEITPHLYETDRVEVGRRLDYSRWVNFVEIASSTRWSEVDERLFKLAERFPDTLSEELSATLSTLEKTDRIEGELMESLCRWLESLPIGVENDAADERDDLLFAVRRRRHFTEAKQLVRKRLPLFSSVDMKTLARYARMKPETLKQEGTDILSSLLPEGTEFCVLLVDETAVDLDIPHKEHLRQFLQEVSRELQVLYFLSEEDGGTKLPDGATVVRYEEMIAGG